MVQCNASGWQQLPSAVSATTLLKMSRSAVIFMAPPAFLLWGSLGGEEEPEVLSSSGFAASLSAAGKWVSGTPEWG